MVPTTCGHGYPGNNHFHIEAEISFSFLGKPQIFSGEINKKVPLDSNSRGVLCSLHNNEFSAVTCDTFQRIISEVKLTVEECMAFSLSILTSEWKVITERALTQGPKL